MRFNKKRGFSLVEVMIVIVIIGLMAGLVAFATTGILQHAKEKKARADVATYSGAVDLFYLRFNRYPGNQEGLKVLVPDFIPMLKNDPWGNPYQYVQPGTEQHPYDIISYGADGREGGTGADADITNWDPDVVEQKPKSH